MSRRSEQERQRQLRLAEESTEATPAARRKELRRYSVIATMLVAGAVVLIVGLSDRPAQNVQIAANLRDGDRILGGQIKDRLSALKQVPVVVNMWASWCPHRGVAALGRSHCDSAGVYAAGLSVPLPATWH